MTRLKQIIEKEYQSMTPADLDQKIMKRLEQRLYAQPKKPKLNRQLILDFLIALVVSATIYIAMTKVRYIEINIPVFNSNYFSKNGSLLIVLSILTIILIEEKLTKNKKTFFI